MKITVVLVLMMLLSGCAGAAWETVEDINTAIPAASWQEAAYSIEIGIPSDLALQEQTADWSLYATENGELEVETRRFLASDMKQAVKTLSGFSADRMTILQTTRFDLPEYQFAWLAQTEQGSRLYRADFVIDGMECYAVVCSRPEEAGMAFDEPIRHVFSTFGLYMDEGV